MTSRKTLARIAGLCYLIVIATGLFAEVFVRQKLIVSGNAVATAHNIMESEMLYRLGFVADLVNFVVGLPCILIFYILFKPVNKHLAMLAVFFVIIQTAIIAVNLSNQLAPLLWLGDHAAGSGFDFNQVATLCAQALQLQGQGYAIGLVFFGFYCMIIGYLIFQSGFLPKVLAVLYALAGVSYLINSFTMFLSIGFVNPLFPYILVPSFIGELSITLWLLVMGVKESKVSSTE
jgi:hypothetical protein